MDFSALSDDYLDITPVRPPPPGRESNLIDPESRAYQVIIVIAVVSFLVVVLSSMRVYTRLKITRTFGVDDCECTPATVFPYLDVVQNHWKAADMMMRLPT